MRKLLLLGFVFMSMAATADTFIPDGGKRMVLTGTVTNLISTPKNVEPSFKAHFLQLDKPITFNDGDGCGEIKQDRIALNEFGMDKYQGEKVEITGTVFCQQQNTGRYHLSDFEIISIK